MPPKSLSDSLRAELPYHRAPDVLRARVRRDLDAATRRSGAGHVWRWVSAAAAVAVVLGGVWLAAGLEPRTITNDAVEREAVSIHLRSLAPNRLAEVVSSDPRRVKPWLAERLDFSPPVTDFADEIGRAHV